jgi:hypothetical protein
MRSLRPHTALLWALTAVAGCATAGPGTNNNGGSPDAKPLPGTPDAMIPGRPDAMIPGTPDAPVVNQPDAMMSTPVTMSETGSSTIEPGTAVSCNQNTTYYTAENSYYRAFRPSDFGVSGAFHVANVAFAVESATAGAGSQSVTVKIHSYTGTLGGSSLDTSQMTQLGTATVVVPDTSAGETVTANVTATVPAGSNFVAEVLVPDSIAGESGSNNQNNIFFIGANTGTETMPGYIRAPGCSTPDPTSMSGLGLGQISVIMTVSGTYP